MSEVIVPSSHKVCGLRLVSRHNTFVQDIDAEGTTSANTLTAALTGITAGNLLVGAAVINSSTFTLSLSDGANTYSQPAGAVLTNATDAWQMRGFYALNVSGGNRTLTATWSGSAGFRGLYWAEFSGLATSSALDTGSDTGLRQTTGTTRNAGTFTASASGDHFAIAMDYNQLATPTVGSGFTSRETGWLWGGVAAHMAESADGVGAGSRSATWGMNNGAISYAIQMFFLAAAAGGGTPAFRLSLLGVGR